MNFFKNFSLGTAHSIVNGVKKFDNKLSKKNTSKKPLTKIKVQKADNNNFIKTKLSKKKSISLLLPTNFHFKDILIYLQKIIAQNFLQKFTYLLIKLTVIVSLVSLLYLSIVDTNYLIQDWNLKYPEGVFLDLEQSTKITNKFQDERMLGILPSNQYWFTNDRNLTYLAKTAVPQVKAVKVLNRSFPNKLTLEINLIETVATLVLNVNGSQQYWRIDKFGSTFTQDYTSKYTNLVYVDTPIIFEDSNSKLNNLEIIKDNTKQLDKIYFTVFIRQLFEKLNYTPTSIRLSSINSSDGIIDVYLGTNTFIRFDVYKFSKQNVEDRVKEVFKSKLLNEKLKSEEINYIDLSIPKRGYVCYKIYVCNIK